MGIRPLSIGWEPPQSLCKNASGQAELPSCLRTTRNGEHPKPFLDSRFSLLDCPTLGTRPTYGNLFELLGSGEDHLDVPLDVGLVMAIRPGNVPDKRHRSNAAYPWDGCDLTHMLRTQPIFNKRND